VEFVLCQRPQQRLAHFPFAAFGGLPIGEADLADDVVDIVDDAFDHDRGVGRAGLLEEFGQGGFGAVFIFSGGDFLFGVDQVVGQVEQGFKEGDAVQSPGLA